MAARSKPTQRRNGAAKPRSKPKPRARRSASLALPVIEQRQLDIIGLALVALGVLLAFVVYGGWGGGRAGDAIVDALRWAVGDLIHAAPLAVVAGGALAVLRPLVPSLRPFRAGAACLLAGVALLVAAGTLGVGPGMASDDDLWRRVSFEERSGALGAGELWLARTLFQTTGAHILALFLLSAGALLVTGGSVAGLLRATGRGVSATSERLAQTTTRRVRPWEVVAPTIAPPEDDTQEVVVRATHVEAPSLDGAHRYPDLYGDQHPGPAADEPVDPDATEQLAFEDEQPDGVDAADPPPAPTYGPEDLTPAGRLRGSVTDDPDFAWTIPAPRFLKHSAVEVARPDTAAQERTAGQLVEALGHFGVDAKVVGMVVGPHITRYELRLAPGIKMSKVAQLKDDLAYALAATDVRILAPIPGKTAVGVEVPNLRRKIVHLGDVFQDPPKGWSPLTVWLGKDVSGKAIGVDLAKMPHLLVAGTTGAGKSGCVNAMLSSILLRATPHEVRLVLVDPKQVELNHYESIPHLLTPVITSPRMAATALQNLVREMEQRYGIMSIARTRSLPELNRVRAKRGETALPYILCVIDELADLMMVAPADVEDSIIRLAQKARAVGIHLVLATQSPRVDVITGMIKANVPSRIAFAVSSQTDSRVILDQNGAESLLGQGDMLFSPVGENRLQRIQGAYVDEEEIAELTTQWRRQGEPEFREELLAEVEDPDGAADGESGGLDADEDPLLEEAIALVAQMGTASTSMLQRRMRLGYTRAGRLIDMLERRGVISGYEGSKPRQVLIAEADAPRVIANLAEAGRLGARGAVATGDALAAPDPLDVGD